MDKGREHKNRKIEHWMIIAVFLMLYDIVTVMFSYFFALWVRFDCEYSAIPHKFMGGLLYFVPVWAVISVFVFRAWGMYRGIWRYSSYSELVRTAAGSVTSSLLHSILITLLFGRMPLSYYVFGFVVQSGLLLVPRFAYRFVLLMKTTVRRGSSADASVMIIGAGEAGRMLLRDINTSKEVNDSVACFIDDNSNKWGRYVEGVPVAGGRDDILVNVKKYNVDKIYIAIPSASAEDKRDIIAICNESDCEVKQIPGMVDLVRGRVTVSQMRDVSVEDLLGREPIKADMNAVYEYINNKVVLVTGGGGSIGSELCRQIASHTPKMLIIFDVYENNAYSIQLELKEKYPELRLETLIGSVRDSRRLYQIFEQYRPQIVYHAAAHKHVPLMESSPNEAIKNNAIGTYKTAYAAMVHGCERFVLISTDKAVNPTNIMGASKRLCEMIIQSFDAKVKQARQGGTAEIPQLYTHVGKPGSGKLDLSKVKTEFVAVRFGNVLGSNGSVIPVFKKQIERGGPVTVTHPDIIRYFMTIPEAVSLVMLAGTYAGGGEIFVLDMGSPVKIDTLARNLIKLSGYKPDVDIKIVYTGLRPGEKLYEEKLMAEEGLKKTGNDMIHIGCPIPFDTDVFLKQLEGLMNAAYANSPDICERVAAVVSTYKDANIVNQTAAQSVEFAEAADSEEDQ